MLFLGMYYRVPAQGQQSTFFKLYDFNGGSNYFDDVKEVENNFYATGLSMLPNTDKRRAYLVGVDSLGDKFLEKDFLIDSPLVSETDIASIYVTPNKEIYLCGSNFYPDSNTIFGYARYPLIVKLDSLGNILWYKVFMENLYPNMRLAALFPVTNNKFMAVGSQQMQDGTDRVTMLFYILDNKGNVLVKNFPSPLSGAGMFSRGRSQLKDKSVLIYGTTYYRNIDKYARSALRVDTNLNIIWAKEYGPILPINSFDCGEILEEDSTAIMPSYFTKSIFFDEYEGYLERINLNTGNSIRNKTYKLSESTIFSGVSLAGDGLMVSGMAYDFDFDGLDAAFWKLDSNWNVLWQNEYFNPYFPGLPTPSENIFAFISTSDGGFLSAGFTLDTIDGRITQDALLIKVDSNGCLVSGCNIVGINTDPAWSSKIHMYPNPSNGNLHLENCIPNSLLKVYNLQGQVQFSSLLVSNMETINLESYPSGLYIIQIQNEQGIYFQEKLLLE